MTPQDFARIEALGRVFVDYDQTIAVTQELEWRHTGPKNAWGAKLTLLTGDSGSGKTAIVKRYAKAHPARMEATGWFRPVVYVELPRPCTIKGTAVAILAALGDPLAEKTSQTIPMVTSRIIKQLKGQRTGLLIIDEFQHLIDPDREKVLKEASDWVKVLLDSAEVPVICVGMPDSTAILAANRQLNRRTATRIMLRAYDWDHVDDRMPFRGFLYLLDGTLPFPRRSGLDDPATAEAICRSCQGLVGLTANLIREAGCLAILHGADHIRWPDFAAALDQYPISDVNWFTGETQCPADGDEIASSRSVRGRKRKKRISDVLG